MAYGSADHEEKKTDNCSPAKIDGTDLQKFKSNNIPYKLSGEKTGNSNQNINKNRKNVSTSDQIIKAAIKRRD